MYEGLMCLASQNQSFHLSVNMARKGRTGRRTGIKKLPLPRAPDFELLCNRTKCKNLHHRAGIGTGREISMHAARG